MCYAAQGLQEHQQELWTWVQGDIVQSRGPSWGPGRGLSVCSVAVPVRRTRHLFFLILEHLLVLFGGPGVAAK